MQRMTLTRRATYLATPAHKETNMQDEDYRRLVEELHRERTFHLDVTEGVVRQHDQEHDGAIRYCTEPACVLVAQHYPAA
jgi:hypothetical protein